MRLNAFRCCFTGLSLRLLFYTKTVFYGSKQRGLYSWINNPGYLFRVPVLSHQGNHITLNYNVCMNNLH